MHLTHFLHSTITRLALNNNFHIQEPKPVGMPQGIVKWFNNKKGFGFITDPSGASADIFVHYSEIRGEGYKTLEEGDTVEFELSSSDRGPKALNVVKV